MVTIGPNETKFSELWIKLPTFCSNENVVYRMSTFFLYRASALMMKNNFEWIGSTCFSTWPSPAAILLQYIFDQTALITCGTGRPLGSLAQTDDQKDIGERQRDIWIPWEPGSWGQHGAHLGPTGPSWAPCWPHESCYLGIASIDISFSDSTQEATQATRVNFERPAVGYWDFERVRLTQSHT